MVPRASIVCTLAIMLVTAGSCRGQVVKAADSSSPARQGRSHRTALAPAQASGTMQVIPWLELGVSQSWLVKAPAGQALDLKPPPGNFEEITVYGRRGRAAAEARRPVELQYEAGQSQAAQRLYAKGPDWDGPDEQRLMSNAKEALGLCGALGGLLTCPNE